MDRRIGDRRSDGLPPAPDTPAKADTGERRRATDCIRGSLQSSISLAPLQKRADRKSAGEENE
jgi:hypothetical protein